jgi:hypothetical protein
MLQLLSYSAGLHWRLLICAYVCAFYHTLLLHLVQQLQEQQNR